VSGMGDSFGHCYFWYLQLSCISSCHRKEKDYYMMIACARLKINLSYQVNGPLSLFDWHFGNQISSLWLNLLFPD
jgi:hypothetical protein